ncbi:MAG: S46 family peptidase [Bacteroidia bacterium]
MKKVIFILTIIIGNFMLTSHKLEEGMFPLSELKNIDLQKAGLKIKPIELYNPNGVSLIDAIVRVGGCTGSFVSNDGLIITNHHCAFSFVQAISTTQNNYINDGFLAQTREQEVQAKGLTCKITVSYTDVSARVLENTYDISNPVERTQAIAKNIKKITDEENKMNEGLQCEVSEMFTGKTYVIFRYKTLKDIRLVYVPARSIGEYGGEKDNWVWPRHSGDFAFLRAYVAPDGSSADYSPANVPYKPTKILKVNPKGVNQNDFVFILGYPGRTFRNQPAAFYKYHEEYMLKYVSDLFDWQIAKMESLGQNNEALQIKYAARIKSLANVTKNYKGKMQGFRRVGLTQKKYNDEAALQQFIDANKQLNEKYGNVIPRINELYNHIITYAPRNLWFDYVYGVSPQFNFASALYNYSVQYNGLKTAEEKQEFIKNNLPRLKQLYGRLFSSFDNLFEPDAMIKMITDAQKFDAKNRIKAIDDLALKFKTQQAFINNVNSVYQKTKLTDSKFMASLFDSNSDKIFKLKDPMLDFVSGFTTEGEKYDAEDKNIEGELIGLLAKYAEAKSVFMQRQFIPDANATLRFTFGYVRGYYPNDAEYHAPFTTLSGVIEKEDGKDYELLQVIKDLYKQRDFAGLYHPELKDLPVNFLYNLDTTGGNSGSPVLNENGELVGVNFDRAFTATINDYAWNEAYSRSVAVDIRYIIWIVKKVAKADYILQEMNVKV